MFRYIVVCLVSLACVFLMSERAHAQVPDTIGIHLGSVHSNARDNVAGKNWNNTNPGAYARWGNVAVGTYYNSIRKESFYVGYVYGITDNIDVTVGAITGYNGTGYSAKPVMPLLVPSLHFGITDKTSLRIHLAPKVAKGGATAVHFSIEYRI